TVTVMGFAGPGACVSTVRFAIMPSVGMNAPNTPPLAHVRWGCSLAPVMASTCQKALAWRGSVPARVAGGVGVGVIVGVKVCVGVNVRVGVFVRVKVFVGVAVWALAWLASSKAASR